MHLCLYLMQKELMNNFFCRIGFEVMVNSIRFCAGATGCKLVLNSDFIESNDTGIIVIHL